ncbi:MAG: hypothetical protein H6510_15990 [Acidobacteria bacterium]|nr:hypothetical protein [Acidobacteriota bacterium]
MSKFTYHEPIPAAAFVDSQTIRRDASAILFPHPNSDWINNNPKDELVWAGELYKECDLFAGGAVAESEVAWPTLFGFNPDWVSVNDTYRLSRAFKSNFFGTRSYAMALWIPPSLKTLSSTTPYTFFNRWLLHIPKQAGGFTGTKKVYNRGNTSTTITFAGYHDDGFRYATVAPTLAAKATKYYPMYGSSGLFNGLDDLISHIAIYETEPQTEVSLLYTSSKTQYGAWADAIDIAKGLDSGSIMEMDASAEAYTDGVAILNLREETTTRVWVVQKDRVSGATYAEAVIGDVPPGGKILAILSNFVLWRPNAVCSFETKDSSKSIQVLGLSFNGFDLFAPKPVQRKD